MMKIGIYSCVGAGHPFEERIRYIANAGFSSVSLDFTETELMRETPAAEQVKIIERYGLDVGAVHLSGDGMTGIWGNTEDAEFVTQRLINELAELKDLGLRTGVAHITWGYEEPEPVSERAMDRFRRIAAAADSFRIRLALENSVFPGHVHHVLDRLENPYLGFCFDSGHENAFSPDARYLERHGDRLYAMHLHDNYGTQDEHNIPFDGTVDWKKKMDLIRKTKLFREEGITFENGPCKGDLVPYLEKTFAAGCRMLSL